MIQHLEPRTHSIYICRKSEALTTSIIILVG
uniref:Uncharacterized protein n=1 Tax=Romanomermis culicivorax TaxID=13658 RepID=A0A915K2M5_ROMCU